MTVIHEEDYEDSQLAVSQLISNQPHLGISTSQRLKCKQHELSLQSKSQLYEKSSEKLTQEGSAGKGEYGQPMLVESQPLRPSNLTNSTVVVEA
jgi:hypothetical protein